MNNKILIGKVIDFDEIKLIILMVIIRIEIDTGRITYDIKKIKLKLLSLGKKKNSILSSTDKEKVVLFFALL